MNPTLNNYFMHGSDAIDPKEKVFVCKSDGETSVHKHDFVEIVYFESGVGTHHIEHQNFATSNGNICLLNTEIEHYYLTKNSQSNELSVLNCIFYPSFFGKHFTGQNFIEEFYQEVFHESLSDKPVRFIQVPVDLNKEISHLFHMLKDEFEGKDIGYLEICKSLIHTILIKILRAHKKNISYKGNSMSFENITLVENIISYLKNNISKSPTLKELSGLYFYSEYYIGCLVKNYTGMSYKTLQQKLKIDEASKLLKTTDLPVLEIQKRIGFSYPKHFNVLFKSFKGTTPTQYRKIKARNK